MPLNLLTIYTDKNSGKDFDTLFKVLPQASRDLDNFTVQKLNKIAQDGLKAFQSKVPVDTKQLREEQIQVNYANKNSMTAKVYIPDQPHTNTPRTKHPPTAPELARILDEGRGRYGSTLTRTRTSIAWEGFSPIGRRERTAGWIQSGYMAFLTTLRRNG